MRSLYRGLLAALVTIQLFTVEAWAQVDPVMQSFGDPAPAFDFKAHLLRPLVLAIVFTVVGLVLFVGAIYLIVRLTPFSIQKEIEEDQNIALGIIIGSIILGIAIILAAAMIG